MVSECSRQKGALGRSSEDQAARLCVSVCLSGRDPFLPAREKTLAAQGRVAEAGERQVKRSP